MQSPTLDLPGQGIRTPDQAYLIGRERYATSSPGFADAIARAYAEQGRPKCLCQRNGVGMYIARMARPNEGFLVKRMPDSGHMHAPGCPSYEPAAELSGLGQLLGFAIVEDPATGQTILKLEFPLTKRPGRSTLPPPCEERTSAKSDGTRLSLRGLLHYLWDKAELTRWHPGFTGRRSWTTVHRLLLKAAEHMVVGSAPLRAKLYIPEPFSVEASDKIIARRHAQWSSASPARGHPTQKLILIAEVKEISPARYGYKAVIKHIPDQPFMLDASLYRRLETRFGTELALWALADRLHMVAIATFSLGQALIPTIDELSLMTVSNEWLNVVDGFDLQLMERLTREHRAFITPMRYDVLAAWRVPAAVLLDTEDAPTTLTIVRPTGIDIDGGSAHSDVVLGASTSWSWYAAKDQSPPLPSVRDDRFRPHR